MAMALTAVAKIKRNRWSRAWPTFKSSEGIGGMFYLD
jgi:hypothetical protein